MRHRRTITFLTWMVIVLGIVASGIGLFSGEESENEGSHPIFTSIRGEQIELYGSGIYKEDSLSAAAQAIAQDGITLAVGIPLLFVSLLMSLRGTIRGGCCWPERSDTSPIPMLHTVFWPCIMICFWSTSCCSRAAYLHLFWFFARWNGTGCR